MKGNGANEAHFNATKYDGTKKNVSVAIAISQFI
jgi:hypothetical protein